MQFGYIEKESNFPDVKYWLCRPNKKVISPIKDIYNDSITVIKGGINTLSFTIPTVIEREHTYIENPLIEKLMGAYLIKVEMDGQIEYFTVVKRNKNSSTSDDNMQIECYSLGFELGLKMIRSYDETAKSIRTIINDVLYGTNWSIDFIDGDVELLRRSVQISSSTILQAIFDIAEKFNCVVEFDSVNRKLSFKKDKNIGINRGLTFKEGINLESFNLTFDDENVATRLYAYGEDNLSFRSLSPTGSNYLEDFSWFMQGFECDANYNVISHSLFMEDSLCIALTKYYKLLDNVKTQFGTLTTNKTNKEAEITTAEQTLSTLESELRIIQNEIDVLNATYQDSASSKPEHSSAISRQSSKQQQINSQKQTISSLKNQLSTIESSLNNLAKSTQMENNFTVAELDELVPYVRDKEYSNTSIIDPEDLLKEAKTVFEDYLQPPLSLTLSIETFYKSFDTNLVKKIKIGDTLRLKSERLKVDVKASITQITYEVTSKKINLTVANVRGATDDDFKFAKRLNNAISTTTSVDMNMLKWNEAENLNTTVNQLLNMEYDTAKNVLLGGTENSVEINERGLYNRDLNDEKTFMVINNGLLAITPDGGNTVTVAISKRGVHAERIIGKILMSNQTYIESDKGLFDINGTSAKYFDANRNLKIELGQYTHNNVTKYGLKVHDGAIDIVNGLPKSQINQSAVQAWDSAEGNAKGHANSLNTSIRSDLRLTSPLPTALTLDNSGITAYTASSSSYARLDYRGLYVQGGAIDIRTSSSSYRGIVLDGNGLRGYNSSGTKTFEIDTYGNGMFAGRLEYAKGSLDNVSGTFAGTVTGDLSANTINAIRITADQITALKIRADMIETTNLSSISANLGNITSGNINISEDLRIGSGIYLAGSRSDVHKGIYFGNTQIMQDTSGWLNLTSRVSIGAFSKFNGSVDMSGVNLNLSGANVIGLNLTARFG